MKIEQKGRKIPRSEVGDPHFKILGNLAFDTEEECERLGPGVLQVFTSFEIVELVNRALYQLEYQRTAHRNRGSAERARLKPLKAKVKEMFHVGFAKATDEQVQKAMAELEKEKI